MRTRSRQPAGHGARGGEAAAALAEIKRRQERVPTTDHSGWTKGAVAPKRMTCR